MRVLLGAMFAAALLLSGCIAQSGPGRPIGGPNGMIEVVNNTIHPIDTIYIAACGTTSTENWLPRRARINPNESYQFDMTPGCWEVDSGQMGSGGARVRVNVQAGRNTRVTLS